MLLERRPRVDLGPAEVERTVRHLGHEVEVGLDPAQGGFGVEDEDVEGAVDVELPQNPQGPTVVLARDPSIEAHDALVAVGLDPHVGADHPHGLQEPEQLGVDVVRPTLDDEGDVVEPLRPQQLAEALVALQVGGEVG